MSNFMTTNWGTKDINKKDCILLEEKELPLLVLATHSDYAFRQKGPNSRKWRRIVHQTAGHGCHHHYMVATVLNPRPKVQVAMHIISKQWLNSCTGMLDTSLDKVLEYRAQLQTLLKMDCNFSYEKFEEGIYPIDESSENINKLCTDKLPDELDKLIKWSTPMERVCGVFSRWHLYILGSNCD